MLPSRNDLPGDYIKTILQKASPQPQALTLWEEERYPQRRNGSSVQVYSVSARCSRPGQEVYSLAAIVP